MLNKVVKIISRFSLSSVELRVTCGKILLALLLYDIKLYDMKQFWSWI